jgi:hypothetical protein
MELDGIEEFEVLPSKILNDLENKKPHHPENRR